MPGLTLTELLDHHAQTPFAQWAGVELVRADESGSELHMLARPDLTQAFGNLHASLIMGILESACGFAVDAVAGFALVTHCDVDFLEPAGGESFIALGRVLRAGRRQSFAEAELFAESAGARSPRIAVARATLIPLPFTP